MRRAVAFLRWDEGDADRLVPSLYAKRRRAKKKVRTSAESPRLGAVEATTPAAATDVAPANERAALDVG